jgi:hypothetical protein
VLKEGSGKAKLKKKFRRAILLSTSIKRSTASGSALCCSKIKTD